MNIEEPTHREYSHAQEARLGQARLVAILAGGESRRMGRDKAQLLWRGVPLLQRLCREADESGARVLVAGRAQPENWPLENTIFLPDETPHLGPLGGLQSALRFAARHEYSRVLAIACDMPFIDAEALRWLFENAEKCDARHGLIARREGQIEPLFAVYSPRCLPLIEERLLENRRSLRGLVESGEFARVEAPPEIARKLANLNTPDEWRAFQQAAT